MQKCGDLVLGQPKQKLDSTGKKSDVKECCQLTSMYLNFIQSWTSRRPWLRYERATNMMFCDMRIKHDI